MESWRENYASIAHPSTDRGGCFFDFVPPFLLDFWREPKSAADGRRMSLRDNLGRAWKASQEAAALKC